MYIYLRGFEQKKKKKSEKLITNEKMIDIFY